MLKEDSERLVRVGPDRPGGRLFRRYWIPALLASEVPKPNSPQVRVRLLGEDLIAYRDTDGVVGLVDAYCPHRRAPMFFGRNEHCGIRCAYHGWKFDRTGACVDMPSEPVGTPMQAKVWIKAYPTLELGGLIWTYMGPPDLQPPPPDFEWLRAPATHRHVSKTFEHCNYLQALEGGLDTAHSSFVHNNRLDDPNMLRSRDTRPKIDVQPTDYGYYYTSERRIDEARRYLRVYRYVMPTQQMRSNVMGRSGEPAKLPKTDGHIWVPIDDETTFVYNWMCSYSADYPISGEEAEAEEKFAGRSGDDLIAGSFRLKRNLSNNYLIDREMQRTRTFTGITGLNTQDFALQEGMGTVVDRSLEHLGTSDRAIVAMRRLMLEAVEVVENNGSPRGLDPLASRDMRPYDGILEGDDEWPEAFAAELAAKW